MKKAIDILKAYREHYNECFNNAARMNPNSNEAARFFSLIIECDMAISVLENSKGIKSSSSIIINVV